MPINTYLKQIKQRFAAGIATEQSYRADLQILLNALVKGIIVTNEPKRQKCGAPDYIIQNKEVPLGYIEAKDVGIDLHKTEKSEQMARYLKSLDNLILTDYLEFRFYKYGQKVKVIQIASIENGKLKIHPENFSSFETHLKDFCDFRGQTIKSAEKLAQMMAQKARMMEEVLYRAVIETDENNSLRDQLRAFQQVLIHDMAEKTFADIYAQTIAYGLFAARLHDPSLETFSRQEARELIPRSNPFLRNLFDYVSGAQLDDRVVWIVDDLADIFRAVDLNSILADFGKATEQTDPFIHFYETFLAEYDPALRKSRGVYYTPEPVVNFIVRAVDDILKIEFGLTQGLADTSKIKIKRRVEGTTIAKGRDKGKDVFEEVEVHKVQILDPATGTGTFLAEVIRQIYKKFQGQTGIWSNYVEEHLIPRLNGFEILMAPYTMCHLKLELLLRETGYRPKDENKQKRLRVFLTNSLEEAHPDTGTLFASWLSKESTEANYVKRDTPVMVVLGNPPYSGESTNKSDWLMNLMEDYKKEPGGIKKLAEKNPKWINDDYVKFLRFGQYFIEKNGEGILAFINPHGFLDNPTFRGMRWNLLKTYDKIYTIDLHGNSKKKETAPDGSPDINVFDIMQGVSINLFLKTGKKKNDELGTIFHFDLYGKRELKYDFLFNNSLKSIPYKLIENVAPNYFFVQKDFEVKKVYDEGFSVVDLFKINSVGIVTARDAFTIHESKEKVKETIQLFLSLDDEIARDRFNLGSDVRDWTIKFAKQDLLKSGPDFKKIVKIAYRPFDARFTYYTGKSKGFLCMPRGEVMQHFLKGKNIGLVTVNRQPLVNPTSYYFTTDAIISNGYIRSDSVSIDCVFPLYLYKECTDQISIEQENQKKPNLNIEIVNKIAQKLGLQFVAEKTPPRPSPKGREELNAPPLEGMGEVPGYVTADPFSHRFIKEIRDQLKNNPTPAEMVLWEYLRNKKTGHKIRRQHIIDDFITDFVCLSKKLVIEIDGKVHEKQKEYDALRSARLQQLGYEVVRFKNEELLNAPQSIADKIKAILDAKSSVQDENIDNDEAILIDNQDSFAPIDLLDYIYAVLYSPAYREKYKEFLKIDFPRVPYPENAETFWKLVQLGGELRQLHLLESPVVEQFITTYPVAGDNKVSKVKYEGGKVWINVTQYFAGVPEIAWGFFIGGYQPAQKWLKDRKDRELSFEDIQHYQKIVIALTETDRIMKEIDEVVLF